jgi:hypothetical protein
LLYGGKHQETFLGCLNQLLELLARVSSGDSSSVDFLLTLHDEREDLSGEVMLQASKGFEVGMPADSDEAVVRWAKSLLAHASRFSGTDLSSCCQRDDVLTGRIDNPLDKGSEGLEGMLLLTEVRMAIVRSPDARDHMAKAALGDVGAYASAAHQRSSGAAEIVQGPTGHAARHIK